MQTGSNFIHKLTQALWYIDPHHNKFAERGIHLPDCFSVYQGYNDYKKKKEKEPRLSKEGLEQHIQQLSHLLMQPWMSSKRFEVIYKDVEKLVDSLHAYKQYLCHQCDRVKSHQQLPQPVCSETNASLVTVSAKSTNSSQYQEMMEKLVNLPLYEPLFLNDIAPVDRYQRRKWLAEISVPFPIMLYKYAYGSNIGTLVYAWRIPEDESVDNTIIAQVFAQLCSKQSFYSTRAMRRDFLDKYNHLAKISKMFLRNIYRTLLQDCSAAEYSSEADVDERVAKAVVELDDPDIVLDLRKLNGKPNSTMFDEFWHELQLYMDEVNLAVDERRHGDVLHMPLAISIRNLQEIVAQ